MNWEIIHALTMIPGFFVTPKSVAYRVFCCTSCAYHFCKALRKRKYARKLQRADLVSQLVACFANSKYTYQKVFILTGLLIASMLNIKKEKQRRIHLGINGISIILCNGVAAPAIYMWSLVFTCCAAANMTHIQMFHSAMHLFGHAAFSLQQAHP